MLDPSDGTAVTIAEHALRDLLARDQRASGCECCDAGLLLPDAEVAARRIVAAHSVTFQRENGLRRLVLVGEWEVDGAHLADQPTLIAAATTGQVRPESEASGG